MFKLIPPGIRLLLCLAAGVTAGLAVGAIENRAGTALPFHRDDLAALGAARVALIVALGLVALAVLAAGWRNGQPVRNGPAQPPAEPPSAALPSRITLRERGSPRSAREVDVDGAGDQPGGQRGGDHGNA